MNKYSLLSVAISSVLLMTSQQSSAAPVTKIIDLSNPSPLIYASENPAETDKLSAFRSRLVIPVPTYEVTATNLFFVKIALKDGAAFSSDSVGGETWSMKCVTAGGTTANAAVANLQVAGGSTLTFRLPTTSPTTKLSKDKTGCIIAGVQYLLKSGIKDISYSAITEYSVGTTPATKAYQGTLITFKDGLSVTYNAAAKQPTIDVGAGSKAFFAGTTQYGDKTAHLGTIKYAPVAGYNAYLATTGTTIAASDVLNNLAITFSGPALGALTNSGAIYLTSEAALECGNGKVVEGSRKKASGTTIKYTYAAGSSTAAKIYGNGFSVCYQNKDANSMDKGKITVSISGIGKGSFRPNYGSEGTLIDIKKNGASTRVLNIPSPDNATDTAFVRINNMTSRTGKVTGTLYGQDGAVLGSANTLLAELKSYEVAILDSAGIAKTFGVSGWIGRAWLQIDSELSTISVQGLVRNNATNTLLNVSDGVTAY